jgi:hypothetical protein
VTSYLWRLIKLYLPTVSKKQKKLIWKPLRKRAGSGSEFVL